MLNLSRVSVKEKPVILLLALGVAACTPQEAAEPAPDPIRGLITQEISAVEESIIRRYPGVLEPAELTPLSFKVSGKLREVDLRAGAPIIEGELLAELDDATFLNDVEDRRAALDEAKALLEQDLGDLQRQQTLFDRNVVSRVTVTDAETDVRSRRAQLTQAERALATAQEDLADTKLYAPFDGLINEVEVESFQTMGVGDTVLSVYSPNEFEVSFSVNFSVAADLVVGTPAAVRLADDPTTVLAAVVSELGERADTVSSFPVVVKLTETSPLIKGGMAVEVSMEFDLPTDFGYLIPIAAAVHEGQIPPHTPGEKVPLDVFVYDPTNSTVRRRTVVMAGIRENQLVVVEGLTPGERIAVAGVSFLRDGMEVKLVERVF